jgi:hypothetical protein
MQLIGNTGDLIDWDEVIDGLKDKKGYLLKYNTETFNPHFNGFSDLNRLWQQAGYEYNDPCVEWINYMPGDFNINVELKFKELVNPDMHPFMVWISKIRPGRMAPWHFDAHSKVEELFKLGEPIRYVCYIEKPTDGHVSIVGDHCIYKPVQGSIYKWDSFDVWHCGLNGGLTDKYMFNYWGYLPHAQTVG